MRFAGLKLKVSGILIALFVSAALMVEHANAAGRNGIDSDVFIRRYCIRVNAKLKGLNELKSAVIDLIAQLQNMQAGLEGMGLNLTLPENCSASLDLGVNTDLGGFDNIAACFNGLNFSIQMPDFSGLASCLTSALPSLDVDMPNFDPNTMLACLNNNDLQIDIRALTQNVGAFGRALTNLLEKFSSIKANVTANFDSDFLYSVRLLGQMCKQAGYKPR